MKFIEETRRRLVDRTIDGTTHQVSEPYSVRVPVLPKDMDAIALKAVVAMVLGLTAVVVVWSTVSIGALLGGGVGFAVAGLFDVSWGVVLLLEYLARFDPGNGSSPAGWAGSWWPSRWAPCSGRA
ncbi:hypothetical protein WKI68_36890 [Streptomyces sp. MS1.HAVA.3]|uniref:Uncharacterized protein n=1 Tax=Streptomyces caledonius TaxID=3134107 RepID=A0ABU8UCP2_9ACTN